jgi:hypothetical protein
MQTRLVSRAAVAALYTGDLTGAIYRVKAG